MATILFVDDEPSVLLALKRSLRKEPYEILTAGSAAEALEILGRTAVDLIVSDERMPGVTGSELLARVRKEYPSVVRFMLTGDVGLRPDGKEIDVTLSSRMLKKPITPQELGEALRLGLKG
jgi:two-component system probable response regulator PhcQ